MNFEDGENPSVRSLLAGIQLGKRLLIWLILDVALVGAFLVSYLALTQTPLPSNMVSTLLEKYEYLRKLLQEFGGVPMWLLIFANNTMVTLLSYIPFIGIILFANTLYWTARVMQLAAIVTSCLINIPKQVVYLTYAFAILFSPHTYLEFFAYSIAVYQNARLSYLIARRRWSEVKREVRVYLLSIPIAIAFLLLGAYVEATLIKIFSGFSPASSLPPPQNVSKVLQACLHNA